MNNSIGGEIYELCRTLFPICRSITGDGFRQSLEILRRELPALEIFGIPTGTKCFDWETPKEWNIRDAYIITPDGKKICDFKKSNLHAIGYCTPLDAVVSLEELQKHLYSLPEQPDAIPYITSYYKERWGFCIAHSEREKLKPGNYRVFVDSDLKDGFLNYGELLIPGSDSREIFISTYLCHPSMANNELSGPAVVTFIAKWLCQKADRRFSYRIVFIPETIGSIAYLSRNIVEMKKNIAAGFNVTCIGDERAYSYLASRDGNTLADRAVLHVLKNTHPDFVSYSFIDRNSDERQYCSPGIDLPLCSVMRTKYGCYPEYHTSLDDLNLITSEGLQGGYEVLRKAINCLELNETLKVSVQCEPQLGKRGLYPTISTKDSASQVKNIINLLAYADGTRDLLSIAELINVPLWEMEELILKLKKEDLLQKV